MITNKTWPYGLQRRARVVITKVISDCDKSIGRFSFQLVQDSENEMHVLVGCSCADFEANNNDLGTITFEKGGPTGGYWKFVRDT
jgi:hypothetical protein